MIWIFPQITFDDVELDEGILTYTVIHEIAHNWEDEGPTWEEFMDASGWTTTNRSFDPMYVEAPGSYRKRWFYQISADFGSQYARTNPFEDFAETFTAYFFNQSNYSSELANATDNFFSQRSELGSEKIAVMKDFVRAVNKGWEYEVEIGGIDEVP